MGDFSRLSVFLIIVYLVFLNLIAGCIFTNTENPRQFLVSSQYKLVIISDAPLSNVTLYIPLPVSDSIPTVGNTSILRTPFERNYISLKIVDEPPGLSIDDTLKVQGNSPLFMEICADSWPSGEYQVEISDTETLESPLFFFETLRPVGNQSIILPKIHFLEPEPVVKPLSDPLSTRIEYYSTVIPQSIPVYMEYRTGPETKVHIFSSIESRNSWKEGYDAAGMNGYYDTFTLNLKGEGHGWQLATGEFRVGEGFYPDFSKGDWKKLPTE